MNPYTPSSSRLFYGRKELMKDVLNAEAAGLSVLLIGGRRCGKTRALERVRDYLIEVAGGGDRREAWAEAVPDGTSQDPPGGNAGDGCMPPHWPILMDVEGHDFTSQEQFMGTLAEMLVERFPEGAAAPGLPDGGFSSTRGFDRWLTDAVSRLEAAGLSGVALLLDQIESLFEEPWHEPLMSFLRRLDDRGLKTRLWLVLAGSDALHEFRHRDGSPPLNTSRSAYLMDLGLTARRRMMTEPFAASGKAPLPDDVVIEVDRLAGGNVWILTHALEHLHDMENPGMDDVREFEDRFLNRQSDILRRWARPMDDLGSSPDVAWKLYQQVCTRGVVNASEVIGSERDARLLMEYESLVHRRSDRSIEIGPAIFRRWAEEHGKVEGPYAEPDPDPGGELPPGKFEYDVALSFAGPQEEFARGISDQLRMGGKKVFYYKELGHELWGADLHRALPETYDRLAKLTLLLVSEDYVKRAWPLVEARATITKALREGSEVVLLVCTDQARLPDVPDGIVWLPATPDESGSKEVALKVLQRLGD